MIQTALMEEWTLSEAQQVVDEWIKTIGVRYFNELTNMALLTEEVGEVARIIARRYGEQSEKPSDSEKVLGDEMADVLFVLICLANQTGVNLNEALQRSIEKKTGRDKNRHAANPKLK
jgi:NTP pyrophosphatase (non-canonical NTP hydrolase)